MPRDVELGSWEASGCEHQGTGSDLSAELNHQVLPLLPRKYWTFPENAGLDSREAKVAGFLPGISALHVGSPELEGRQEERCHVPPGYLLFAPASMPPPHGFPPSLPSSLVSWHLPHFLHSPKGSMYPRIDSQHTLNVFTHMTSLYPGGN